MHTRNRQARNDRDGLVSQAAGGWLGAMSADVGSDLTGPVAVQVVGRGPGATRLVDCPGAMSVDVGVLEFSARTGLGKPWTTVPGGRAERAMGVKD
jgi:hypothetical protein